MSNPYKAYRSENPLLPPTTIDDRVYAPSIKSLKLSEATEQEVVSSCIEVVVELNQLANFFPSSEGEKILDADFEVSRISGGITNGLFRVTSEKHSLVREKQLLIRIFGAEGMIDRDVETSIYASLCTQKIGPERGYLARFGNGRVEGWLEGFKPLTVPDLSKPELYRGVASAMGRLHAFQVPENAGAGAEPQMWNDLNQWGKQATKALNSPGKGFLNEENDRPRAEALNVPKVIEELTFLRTQISDDSPTAFCHNDILAANIMTDDTGTIQLIDFEYGTMNFVAFDLANHFNEWAGGTDDGVPDYSLLPSKEARKEFVAEYVNTRGGDLAVDNLLEEVDRFMWANNIYWGLWAVNQAAAEGCNDFDYLLYAENRFNQYYRHSGRTK